MLISFGGYFANYSHFQRVLFIVDVFLISTICFAIGMLLSSIINEYMTKRFTRRDNPDKIVIFGEVLAECLFTTFLIYFVLFGVNLIPSIVKNPPVAHNSFRLIGAEFLLTFAIVACQLEMLDKIRYLFNERKDFDAEILGNVIEDFRDCSTGANVNDGKGFVCKPP